MSPLLFMLYISELTDRLTKSGLGFNLANMDEGRTKSRHLPGLPYADDIVLTANSATELQALPIICAKEATRLGLHLNPKKSAVMTGGGND